MALSTSDLIRMLVLAAVWGGGFLLTRIAAPALGAFPLTFSRIFIGGLALLLYFRIINFKIEWKKFLKMHFFFGVFYTALPFSLFAYSAQHLPASIMVILNASTPLWGTLLMAAFSKEPSDQLTVRKIVGLFIGIIGVGTVVMKGSVTFDDSAPWAILAGLMAGCSYALAATVMKLKATQLNSKSVACTSQLLGAVILLPLLFTSHIPESISWEVTASVLGLALFCSALAFVLYFQLLMNIGPSRAMSVTFLMPIFGMLWGYLFLNEIITLQMLVGCALILVGTRFVVYQK